ncbi:MAG: PEPxxWA-CTERM sorting domain-containing protein [Phenylobacterium sp.]|nr:PEPxxWA-CTERM sorting domain-containing protein [Phenylobacterium sp.]
MHRLFLTVLAVTVLGSGPAETAALLGGDFEQPGGEGAAFPAPASPHVAVWTTVDAAPGGGDLGGGGGGGGGGGVPEPATWALMIGGFGLAGAGLRRQRRLARG